MARRFTTAEKGKSIPSSSTMIERKRIRAPDFDTSALIQANALTLIGRLTNPQEQRVSDVISSLPRKWNLEGSVTGSDLGQSCFQFRLTSEKDLKEILNNCPYHCNNWMVILQRWEPVISPTFPSQIPFWIKLQGLPLHFWHEKMIYEIGHELGHLDKYDISRTSARMRVFVDALSPLIKESVIDFDAGEESFITFEYEGLKNHCSSCNRLSHLRQNCPFRSPPLEDLKEESRVNPDSSRPMKALQAPPSEQAIHLPPPENARALPPFNPALVEIATDNTSFSQRRDRHGNPFGERISNNSAWVRPLVNKITPRNTAQRPSEHQRNRESNNRGIAPPPVNNREGRRDRTQHQRRSPYSREVAPYPRNRFSPRNNTNPNRREVSKEREEPRVSPEQTIRGSPPYTRNRPSHQNKRRAVRQLPDQQPSSPGQRAQSAQSAAPPERSNPRNGQQPLHPYETTFPPRPPLERNLYASDFTPPPQIRTTEDIMEELREVTFRYTNHPDPKEREARIQRVLDSEANGLMEETAARLIANDNLIAANTESPAQQLICFRPEPGYLQTTGHEISFAQDNEAGPSIPAPLIREGARQNRPPKPKRSQQTTRGLLGPSLRKINLSRSQRSPSVRNSSNGEQATTPARSSRRRQHRVNRSSNAANDTPNQQGEQEQEQEEGNPVRNTQPATQLTPRVDFRHLGRDLP